MSNVTLLFFGTLQEQVGQQQMVWPINSGTRVSDIIRRMELNGPILCAVNHQQVDLECQLQAGDELALMPPMAGG